MERDELLGLLSEALEVIDAVTSCTVDGDHNGHDRFIAMPLSTLEDARAAAASIQQRAGL